MFLKSWFTTTEGGKMDLVAFLSRSSLSSVVIISAAAQRNISFLVVVRRDRLQMLLDVFQAALDPDLQRAVPLDVVTPQAAPGTRRLGL